MVSLIRFLETRKKFTLHDFIREVEMAEDDVFIVLRQLERWGYILRKGEEYYVLNTRWKGILK